MDTKSRVVFGTQIRFQCKAILVAHQQLEEALGAPRVGAEAWLAVQNLLVAAANLWKLFRGRDALLETYEMADSLLRNLKVRNHFEHMDKRVDEWREKSGVGYIDFTIAEGPPNVLPEPKDVFRHLDLRTMRVTFWGDDFDIPAIVGEAERIIGIFPRVEPRVQWP